NGSTNRIELNNLASGMYVLQVQDSQNQTVKVEKLMVSK
ncbi:MAG: T9SS type A sorting domain-containing protein, partial [Mangrovimonas sp.]|nr:T9SS type A sorting domain-containing protein [Mangrovimonas sp.]